MIVAIVVPIVVVLLLVATGVVVARRRGRRAALGPPPGPTPVAPPRPGPGTEGAPPVRELEELAEELEELEERLEGLVGGVAGPEAAVEAPAASVPELVEEAVEAPAAEAPEVAPAPLEERPRLRDRVGRARAALGAPLGAIRRRGRVDEATFEELEEALLLADVGLSTTQRLLEPLRARVKDGSVPPDPAAVLEALRADAVALFEGEDRSLHVAEGPEEMTVWLVVGVNGVGKTTTIGKLASAQVAEGHRVVLAAGDTFRAAAGEQLETWAARAGASIVRGAEGADPSSVVFDAVQHATARGADLVLADTAGRLHTKVNLMEELRKVRRVADRPPGKVSEVLLVLDATTGQNGLVQARQFTEAASVTGVVLTKLDGTAKGGVALAIRAELGLPIKLAGVGEGVTDLVAFDPEEFVGALFD